MYVHNISRSVVGRGTNARLSMRQVMNSISTRGNELFNILFSRTGNEVKCDVERERERERIESNL